MRWFRQILGAPPPPEAQAPRLIPPGDEVVRLRELLLCAADAMNLVVPERGWMSKVDDATQAITLNMTMMLAEWRLIRGTASAIRAAVVNPPAAPEYRCVGCANVSGALVDAGGKVPEDPSGYGGAVAALALDRDVLRVRLGQVRQLAERWREDYAERPIDDACLSTAAEQLLAILEAP